METLAQIVGWLGTFLIVFAYFLISSKRIDESNKYYQLMNFFGAFGVGVNVFFQQAWPALALQIVWGTIAINFLLYRKRKT